LIVVGAVPKIEHLVWADTGYDAVFPYELTPPDPTVQLDYTSKPILEFDVPPSLLASTIFFEWNGSLSYTWSGNNPRRMVGEILYQFISPLIPAGVVVQGGMTICSMVSNNPADLAQTGSARASRYAKHVLRKGKLDWWGVFYKAEPTVPYPDAIPLLSKLIKNGFHVQVLASGSVRGVASVRYVQVTCHVTRTAS